MADTAAVAALLGARRLHGATERQTQDAIAAALRAGGYGFEREARLGPGCRIDFLVGRVGVEVKTDGSSDEVARQIRRYLETGRLDGVVLATRRVVHLRVPRILADERVVVVALPLAAGGL